MYFKELQCKAVYSRELGDITCRQGDGTNWIYRPHKRGSTAIYGPLADSGTWIFEMTFMEDRGYSAASIGVVCPEYNYGSDTEYTKGYFGFYHGGSSRNTISDGKRVCRYIPTDVCPEWGKGSRVGIIVDLDAKTLCCTVDGKALPDQYTLRGEYQPLPSPVLFAIWTSEPIQVHIPRLMTV
jgi:hypothetical protein